MVNQDYQYIVIGAGCAGLQLVKALLELPKSEVSSILILESNPYHSEKSWCFWHEESHQYSHLVRKEWHNISFNSSITCKTTLLKKSTYQYINSTDFIEFHLDYFKKDDRVTIINDLVLSISEVNDQCYTYGKKNTYTSSIIFNSIPALTANEVFKPKVWQHFLGWEISTESESFNKDKVTLMDFEVDENNDSRFIYILPFSEKLALIECTVFSKILLPLESYEKSLKKYIEQHFGGNYSVISKEIGTIPMQPIKTQTQFGNIIPIGTAAGCIKPSTGYSFYRNMENTKRIIALLKSPSLTFPIKHRFVFYDSLLLWIISNNPTQIKRIFSHLFKKNAINDIFLFLDEKTTIWQDIKIFLSLPKIPFLTALFKLTAQNFYMAQNKALFTRINKGVLLPSSNTEQLVEFGN